MENAAVQAIIAANPKACYRTLERKLHKAGVLDEAAGKALAAARPGCGYDCDEGCPVSGRCEG